MCVFFFFALFLRFLQPLFCVLHCAVDCWLCIITELLALSYSFVWICLWYDIPSRCPWAVMTPCWGCKACARAWGALPGWLIASVMKQHTGPGRYFGSSVYVCVMVLHPFTVSSNNCVWRKSGACEGQCVLAWGEIVNVLRLSQELYMYSNN